MTVCVAAAYFLIGWRHTWCWCSCYWGVGGGISWLLDCQRFVDEINTRLCVRVCFVWVRVWGVLVHCWVSGALLSLCCSHGCGVGAFLVLSLMVVWGVV